MSKKYELTDETKVVAGHTLHRIRALKDFGNVEAGDLGGFVEFEDNLSQNGTCWVYDEACVYCNAIVAGDTWIYNNAIVAGNAKVFGTAAVYGEAKVYDDAQVYDNAWVCGNAEVYDSALVYGRARVYGNAMVYDTAEVHGDFEITEGIINGDADVC